MQQWVCTKCFEDKGDKRKRIKADEEKQDDPSEGSPTLSFNPE